MTDITAGDAVAKECEGQVVIGSDTVDARVCGPGGFVEAVGAKVCWLGALDGSRPSNGIVIGGVAAGEPIDDPPAPLGADVGFACCGRGAMAARPRSR